jgi:hypothetical protein
MGCLSSPGFRTILPHEALDSNDAWPDLERPVEKLIETARDLTGGPVKLSIAGKSYAFDKVNF